MINKQEVLDKLEEERKMAVECRLPQMALGFVQAIKIIKKMEEKKSNEVILNLARRERKAVIKEATEKVEEILNATLENLNKTLEEN